MGYPWPNPEGFQTVEDAFLRVMTSTVRIFRRLTSNEYAEETYAVDPVLSPAYLEGSDEDFTTPSGNTVHTTGIAYFGFVIPWLSVNDQMWVEDSNVAGGWRRTTMGGIAEKFGPEGLHHHEVYYGPLGAVGQGIGSG